MSNKSIFDKIMSLKILKRFYPFYIKHKQTLLYLFFGGLSFILSSLIYMLFTEILHMNLLIANIITWILIVAFCFITNKTYVFEYDNSNKSLARQITGFYIGRLTTLLIEEIILYIFITMLNFNNMIVKIIAQIIVIILNYIISKFMIFKKKG